MDRNPHQQAPSIAGLVLAGGRSRRFGADKAAIEYERQPLLARTVDILHAVLDEVYVSVRADQCDDAVRRRYQLVVDEGESRGPASGMLAAHREQPEIAWLVVACDMPGLDDEALKTLLRARTGHSAATAYRSPADGYPEPLCAIYEPDTLARFQRRAAAGEGLSPREFLANADVELVDAKRPGLLSNINTIDDLVELRAADEIRKGKTT
jgi:molybdopterin-guanine dinucleotide biosynthesis protein A